MHSQERRRITISLSCQRISLRTRYSADFAGPASPPIWITRPSAGTGSITVAGLSSIRTSIFWKILQCREFFSQTCCTGSIQVHAATETRGTNDEVRQVSTDFFGLQATVFVLGIIESGGEFPKGLRHM